MTTNIEKLINFLESPAFQNSETGLFHPTYIYTYKAEDEYLMQENLQLILARLKRPNHFLDSLLVNLYDELIAYLKSNALMDATVFDEIVDFEKEDAPAALKWLFEEVHNEAFITYFSEKIKAHFGQSGNKKKVYLLIEGVGDVFPYLRASDFLKRIESLAKNFKVILFYPGVYQEKYYNLFGELKTDNIYRATLLNQLI